MRISEVGSMITIDCELQDAYSGSNNRNSTLTLSGNFPELPAGRTVIAFTGSSVTRVEVIPRWYTI